jgi:hypothetical protein
MHKHTARPTVSWGGTGIATQPTTRRALDNHAPTRLTWCSDPRSLVTVATAPNWHFCWVVCWFSGCRLRLARQAARTQCHLHAARHRRWALLADLESAGAQVLRSANQLVIRSIVVPRKTTIAPSMMKVQFSAVR